MAEITTQICKNIAAAGKVFPILCRYPNHKGPGYPVGVPLPYFDYNIAYFTPSGFDLNFLSYDVIVSDVENGIYPTNHIAIFVERLFLIPGYTSAHSSTANTTIDRLLPDYDDYYPLQMWFWQRDEEFQNAAIDLWIENLTKYTNQKSPKVTLYFSYNPNQQDLATVGNAVFENYKMILDSLFSLPNQFSPIEVYGRLLFLDLRLSNSDITYNWNCTGAWFNRAIRKFRGINIIWQYGARSYAVTSEHLPSEWYGSVSFSVVPVSITPFDQEICSTLQDIYDNSGGNWGLDGILTICDIPEFSNIGLGYHTLILTQRVEHDIAIFHSESLFYFSAAYIDGHIKYNLDSSYIILDSTNESIVKDEYCEPNPAIKNWIQHQTVCETINITPPPGFTPPPKDYILRTLPTSVLLRSGSIAPIYPTFVGSYVYDLFLKKWGKMKQVYKQIFDFLPINSDTTQTYPHEIFGIQGALFNSSGKIKIFDEQPTDSVIVYGKIGLSRHGMTSAEEFLTEHKLPFTGSVELLASLDGKTTDPALTQAENFTDQLTTRSTFTAVGRWFIVKIKGIWDLCYTEFRGYKTGRR